MGRRKTTVTTMNQKMLDSGDFKYSGQLAMNEWIWTKTGLGISLGSKDLADYLYIINKVKYSLQWSNVLTVLFILLANFDKGCNGGWL